MKGRIARRLGKNRGGVKKDAKTAEGRRIIAPRRFAPTGDRLDRIR